MKRIELTYLNGPDIARLGPSDDLILTAVEQGLRAQGRGETVIEPRVHLHADPLADGHFNVLRGSIPALGLAGVKVVGDFVENYRKGLPSEMALLCLFDPSTGMPKAIVDATAITEMRTGAMTAIGARHLARSDARVSGTSGRAEPLIGTYVCSTGYSTSTRSGCILAAARAGTSSPAGCQRILASRCTPPTTGAVALRVRTSLSRPRG